MRNTDGKLSKSINKSTTEAQLKPDKRKFMDHKFENIDYNAYCNVIKVCPQIVLDKELDDLSEQALVDKGMKNYLNNIKEDIIKPRVIYGFTY